MYEIVRFKEKGEVFLFRMFCGFLFILKVKIYLKFLFELVLNVIIYI